MKKAIRSTRSRKTADLPQPSEHDEQAALFQWAEWMQGTYPELEWLYAVPNGTRTTIRVAARMKAEGVKKGVPDICLPVARPPWHGLYIEMKTARNYPSQDQKRWLAGLREQGYYTICCHGYIQAVETIKAYLKGEC